MTSTLAVDATYLLVSLALSIANLICWVPTIGQLILRTKQCLHNHVTSDIPGNPMVFDDLIICLMRTLPEPSNFNIVWTGIEYGHAFRVDGELPNSRMNSLSLYCRQQEPPITIDFSKITLSPSRRFEVILYPEHDDKFAKSISNISNRFPYPSHWTGGYFAMRNYLVPPGTRVVTPHVQSLDSKSTINRLPQILYAGNTGIKNHDLFKMKRVGWLNVAVALACMVLFQTTFKEACMVVLMGFVFFRAFYGLLFVIGKRGLVKHFATVCPRPNELFLPDAETASKVSQPSKEHKYWVMRYDLRTGEDILVSNRILPSNQKYWSLVVYDEFGLPLSQFVNDLNVQFYPSGESALDQGQPHEEYELRIRMTQDMPRSQYSFANAVESKVDATQSRRRVGYAYVDVTGQSKGYVLFRIVHPVDDEVAKFSAPRSDIVQSLSSFDAANKKFK